MDSKEIINNIKNFFKTAEETALAEVHAVASMKIEGDVTIEEYLSSFSSEYFYSEKDQTNCSRGSSLERRPSAPRPRTTPRS